MTYGWCPKCGGLRRHHMHCKHCGDMRLREPGDSPAGTLLAGLAAAALAVLRFQVPTHALSGPGTYEALAHLFVGGLLGAWLAGRRRAYLAITAALTVVELVAFFTRR